MIGPFGAFVVEADRRLNRPESRPIRLASQPPHREGDDLASSQRRHEVVEQHRPPLPAVHPDVGRPPDLLQTPVRVTVEVARAAAVSAPRPHRIVAADDAIAPSGSSGPPDVEEVVHRVEDRPIVGVLGVVIAADKHDPPDRETVADR